MCSISGACGRGRSNHNKSGNKFTNKKEECYNCHRYWHLALKTRNEAAAMRHIWPKIMVTRKRYILIFLNTLSYPQLSLLINENIFGKCFRSCSSFINSRISPLIMKYELSRLSRLIITPITKANTIRSKSCGVITC
ncbi:hypothetical protein QL285_020306 [Trifolium repens]|nr:hypothetical protein QL285_020306 [Trifolium repens]